VVPKWLIFNNATIAEVQHLDFFDSLVRRKIKWRSIIEKEFFRLWIVLSRNDNLKLATPELLLWLEMRGLVISVSYRARHVKRREPIGRPEYEAGWIEGAGSVLSPEISPGGCCT